MELLPTNIGVGCETEVREVSMYSWKILCSPFMEGKGILSKTLEHFRWLRVTGLFLLAWDFVGLSTKSPVFLTKALRL